ncbi:proteasome accessory factor PafA2 family protein [Actinomyces vulturis]|uniref:proteasome accessory factor PafA2 family protein n=1 Tax=Actinomyces vulturis TaxID=1857645 RepID=UPI00082B04EF|nr:proteasome accessory factor PafA2 family protein [Actinomyces vulturis]
MMSTPVTYHPEGFEGPRIVGIETEYGVVCTPATTHPSTTASCEFSAGRHTKPGMDSSQAAALMFAEVSRRWGGPSRFCESGGRLYLDVGDHPEYATAECLTLQGVLGEHQRGDMLVASMVERAQNQLDRQGLGQRLHVIKTNADSWGNSFGLHENYMVPHGFSPHLSDVVATHLILRTLWCSTGDVSARGWRRSARAPFLHHVESATTTRSRPLINTRDEAHADSERFRRLHVISGDSTMTPAPLVLAVGSTILLLAALDQGMETADLTLTYPLRALKDLNAEEWTPSTSLGTTVFIMRCGKHMQAIDLARVIFERVYHACEGMNITGMDDVVFDLWHRSILACEQGFYDQVEHEWEWLITHRLCQEVMSRHHCSWDDPLVKRTLLAFHDVGPQGLTEPLRQAGLFRTFKQEIMDAYQHPDKNFSQRAIVRGQLIRDALASGTVITAGWTSMRLPDHRTSTHRVLRMMNPWSVEATEVESFAECVNHRLPPPPPWA